MDFDLDFECTSSFNHLFNKNEIDTETIYIANSKINFLQFYNPFFNARYCACFMAMNKNHPIWNRVIDKLVNTDSKYIIGSALDMTLQESNYKIT